MANCQVLARNYKYKYQPTGDFNMQPAVSDCYITQRKTADYNCSSRQQEFDVLLETQFGSKFAPSQRAIDLLLEALFASKASRDTDESIGFVCNHRTLISLIPRRHPQAAAALKFSEFFAMPVIRKLVRAKTSWCEFSRINERSNSHEHILRVSSEIRLDNDDPLGCGRKVDVSTLIELDGAFPAIRSCVVVYEEEIGGASHVTLS